MVRTEHNLMVAWAAGILEGEGCFSIFHRKNAKWDHKSVAIHCEMTDQDTILKLSKVFNVGTVNERPNLKKRVDGSQRKTTWIWSVQNHKDIQLVLYSILEFLGERRTTKALDLLEYIDGR